jgi:hypothetical protein
MGAAGADNADHQRKGKPPSPLHDLFNEQSAFSEEIEIKLLVKDNDPAVFALIVQYFRDRNWIVSESHDRHLLTRQLETPNRSIYDRNRASVRIRGECTDNDLDHIVSSDICIKQDRETGESGELHRGEYEEGISSFSEPDFKAVLRKYPKNQYPELHEILDGISAGNLREYFRIDCIRNRYLIEIPESETGLKDKRCVAELIHDDVAFVFDPPGLDEPFVFHYDMEAECEIMLKPCGYDPNPEAHKYVSSPMTETELNQAMKVIKGHILAGAPPGALVENRDSKARRGFRAFIGVLEKLRDYIVPNRIQHETNTLSTAFLLKDVRPDGGVTLPGGEKTDIFHLIGRSFKFVLDRHPLARHKPDPHP